MKIAQVILAALVFIAVRVALAAGSVNMDEVWSHLLIPQFVNFSIVVFGLAYLLKNPIKKHFAEKATQFAEQKLVAERARQEAESKNAEIKALIRNVEESAQKSIDEAKAQAANVKNQLVNEAQQQAKKIEEEALRMAKFEHERAISMLRTELITNSVRFAENKMKESVDGGVQKKLNEEFIVKVGAVRV